MKNHKELTDVSLLTRDQVVPYYEHLICHKAPNEEVGRINQLILSKWSISGLLYIKKKAWKNVSQP